MKNIFVLYTGGTIGMHPGEHGLEPDPALAQHALAAGKAKGVMLAFAGSLFPAVGSSKCSTERDAGFTNHRFGALNPQGADVSGCFLAPPAGSLKREIDPAKRIAAVFLLPGSEAAAAHTLNSGESDGAVILGYGHGNAPAHPSLLAAAQQYCAGGRPLLLISQTPDGCAAPVYAQSAPLLDAGALAAGYCNTETAAALLLLAASNGWQHDDIRTELQRLQLLPAA